MTSSTVSFTHLLSLLHAVGLPASIAPGNDKVILEVADGALQSVQHWRRDWDEARRDFFWATCKTLWWVEGAGEGNWGVESVGPSFSSDHARVLLNEVERLYYSTEGGVVETLPNGNQMVLEGHCEGWVIRRLHEPFY